MSEKIRYRVVLGRWRYWSVDNHNQYEPSGGIGLGVGRGEEKVAWEIEHVMGRKCKVMGGSYPYDILEDGGDRWEVKEPNDRLNIRLGSAGIKAALPLIEKVRATVETLKSIISDITVRLDALKDGPDLYHLGVLMDQLQNDLASIQKGEVSRGLVFGKTNAHPLGLLQMISSLYNSKLPDDTGKMLLEILERELQETWNSVSVPSKTLEDVTGVILVDQKEGYALIPFKDMDNHLEFERVTQGKALYRIKELETKEKSSYVPPVQLSFDFGDK